MDSRRLTFAVIEFARGQDGCGKQNRVLPFFGHGIPQCVGLKCGRSRRRDYTDSAGATLRRKVYELGMEGTLEGYQADLCFLLRTSFADPSHPIKVGARRVQQVGLQKFALRLKARFNPFPESVDCIIGMR